MPAARTSWKGFLKLSLVSVPVKAYTAHNTSETVRLNQLHSECHARVKYQKICPEHGELKPADIVSGYEYTKDQYVVIDPEEVSKLRKESDRAIHIHGFVDPGGIDAIYNAGKTYYLLPDGMAGTKPYALMHRGMIDSGVVALAKIVLAGRENLVMVRPVENMLVMTVLNFAKKIKPIDQFTGDIEEQELSKDELALAKTLIDASTLPEVDLASYSDPYNEQLQEIIRLKIDGQEIVQAPDPEEPKILNLMDALKKSVAEAQASGGAKKMAPSAAKKKSSRGKKSG